MRLKKRYVSTTMISKTHRVVRTAEQQDKIARLYALAEKLHVKIGER